MRVAFIPHIYVRKMYQKLQNLRQGTHYVDEYTTEFFRLVARVDLAQSDDQLVSG